MVRVDAPSAMPGFVVELEARYVAEVARALRAAPGAEAGVLSLLAGVADTILCSIPAFQAMATAQAVHMARPGMLHKEAIRDCETRMARMQTVVQANLSRLVGALLDVLPGNWTADGDGDREQVFTEHVYLNYGSADPAFESDDVVEVTFHVRAMLRGTGLPAKAARG